MKRQIVATFGDENLIVPNPTLFNQKLHTLREATIHNIDLIADFDFTLTLGESSFGIITHSPYTTEQFRKKQMDLFHKYYPYERDTTMPLEEKDKHMHEWWNTKLHNIAEQGFDSQFYIKSLDAGKMELRYGIKELFEATRTHNINNYIISAGISQIITTSLNEAIGLSQYQKNTQILANDQVGNEFSDFKTPMISTTSKSKLFNHTTFPGLRQYGILLGDTVEDTLIPSNASYKCVLNIGYFNQLEGDFTKQEQYYKFFDVVICGKGSVLPVIGLIKYIASGNCDPEYAKYYSCKQLFSSIAK